MRRLFGPRDGAAREEVLVAADIDASSEGETDFEASAARREVRKGGEKKRRADDDARKGQNEVRGDGQT